MGKLRSTLVGSGLLLGGWALYRSLWGKPLRFNHAVERITLQMLRNDPERLTRLGMIENTWLDFHSDKFTDVSPVRERAMLAHWRDSLELIRSYDRGRLGEQEQLTYDIVEWYLEHNAGFGAFPYHYVSSNRIYMGPYPISQVSGVHISLPGLMERYHRVVDVRSARNYVSRLSQVGVQFDQALEGLRQREAQDVIPPRFMVERVLAQLCDFVARPPAENVLLVSLERKLQPLGNLRDAQKAEFCRRALAEIENTVYPAYHKLYRYFEVLKDRAGTDDGLWRLPDGETYYAHLLRGHTTFDLTSRQVHDIGLSEMARIEAEMREILGEQGYRGKSVGEHMQDLLKEQRFFYPDTDEGRAQVLAEYKHIIDEIDQNIGDMFYAQPMGNVQVERIPEFREKQSPTAYGSPPSLDGVRPGAMGVNLRDVKQIFKFGMRTLAYHEAIPGHVFQGAIAQKVKGVPTFRRINAFNAYIEGWALYGERLAWEYGYHEDPFSNLGRLQAELWRAVRLVVDTGLHVERWTREQAVAYLVEHTGMPEVDMVAEVERYIASPGQSCSYKIGMLKMLELREMAQRELGDAFDIREFHAAVLQNGSMPMDVLERVVQRYVRTRKGLSN